MKKSFFFIILFFSFFINCYSQFSKTHYIPPLSGSSNVISEDQYLYISTPNTNPINFKIIEIGGNIIQGTVSKSTPYEYYIGFGNDTQLHVDASISNAVFNNKGYIVEADDLVYVSARVTAGNGNQAGELVSKGLASLGNRFRIGAFTNENAPSYGDVHTTFISVLATENNTTVTFSEFKPGVVLTNSATGDAPFSITLNSGESYVIDAQGPIEENRSGLIGSLVTSDKPIAVNCGSFGGTNGEMGNLDLGFDQIVSADRTGTEYIFIKSTGMDNVERVLLVADEDNTEIYLDGATSPNYILSAGQYIALHGYDFNANGNLYVSTINPITNIGKKVFAYQSIGDNGLPSQANQELFFVPPLSCQTPHIIDNIPFIDLIGTRQFTGRVTLVTKTGATLNFTVDGSNYSLATLPATVDGPISVNGNPNYETYVITGLTGTLSVYSSGELYLAAYGSSNAATFGGFYSGFTFKPEVSFNLVDTTQSGCIPNTILKVNQLSPFDIFQWYFNGTLISGATDYYYKPEDISSNGLGPGYYYVSATIFGCTLPKDSDNIPVSDCPTDKDNDGINDNIDLDNDNDGVTNCNESYGDQNFNLTNTTTGSIQVGSFTDTYTGSVSFSGVGVPSSSPVIGDAVGNFVTEAALGKNNSVKYTITFNTSLSARIEYASAAAITDLLKSDSEIRISCPVNKTLTILNPNDQLLIDTNYDGIFESGITQYSSFEIRFRLNSATPLAAGTGTFSIRGNLINSISIENINLSENDNSKLALRLIATCVPLDSDNDGVPDQYDYDSDNDSIPDVIENQGQNIVALSGVDTNGDGIDDIFGNGIIAANNDSDTYPNYLDLDSDNDGIFDIIESGSAGNSNNTVGTVANSVGSNGLENTLETSIDSGILNYTITDSDTDGTFDYIETDSDNDGCNDVIEANFTDANNDGMVGGDSPPIIGNHGVVVSTSGYSVPNGNYIIAAPITITTQPQNKVTCELQSAVFSLISNVVDSYQWQLSIDNGVTWNNITNNTIYSGAITDSLTVSNVAPSMNGYQYRVFLNRTGNSCGQYSASAILTTYALPVITSPVTLKQCDVSTFNLTQINNAISTNYINETFTYYTTYAAADTNDTTLQITNPIAYTTTNSSVFVRVVNSNGCYSVATLNLVVSVTQIPASYTISNRYKCDDYIDAINDDKDGIASFDFSDITNTLLATLPPPASDYTVRFYKNQADFLAETDVNGNSLAISNTSNYRNIGYPNQETIWVRVEKNNDNSCFGFRTFDVMVEALPIANLANPTGIIRHCDDDGTYDGIFNFDTSNLETFILNGQNNVTVTYTDDLGNSLNPLPNPLTVTSSKIINYRVTNNSTQSPDGPCYDENSVQFIVDSQPTATPISSALTTICDDEPNPLDQNGIFTFNTASFESTILNGQTGVDIFYYDQNNNPIIPYPTFTTASQNVSVVIENPINRACKAQITLPFIVNPTPKIDLLETKIICLQNGSITLMVTLLDGSSPANYSYQWFLNGNPINSFNSPIVNVTSPGIYTVEVTNSFNCPMTKTITVNGSDVAQITSIDVTDLTDINTIVINVDPTSPGDYEYSIDNKVFQESNIFTNLSFGAHEVFVNDKNGCGLLGPIIVYVLGAPHYFTPNGDGYHDYWNIEGINDINKNSIIYIFDRFGKLIKQINASSEGWDGNYNGYQMPADDYWYMMELGDGRSAKGHFALKR